jgi:hypothetical protein
MRKTISSKSVFLLVFLLAARPLQAQVPWNENGPAYLALARAACKELERVAEILAPFRMIVPLADGGGDGGGGDGGGGDGSGGGDGGSSGDGSGSADGSGNGDAGDGNSDGNGGDATATADTTDTAAVDAIADPTSVNDVSDPLDAIMDMALTDPRGGVESSPSQNPGLVGAPSLASSGSQDVAIHAVIISGVQSPWDAISKAPGVGHVTLTGGLISLGRTPQPGEPIAGRKPPAFLKIIPDPKLLNGSIIPPIVPNVIDVRIVGYSVTAEMPGN